jgi:fatty acid amide hydrolase
MTARVRENLRDMAAIASSELIWIGAAELARLIRAKEVSANEAVEACLARIEELNPKLNSVAIPLFEQARREASEADVAVKRGDDLGPLHGVPITIKEQFQVKGQPSTWGLPSRARELSDNDGPLVHRLRQAGGIVVGITNVPQLLLYTESDNPVYGRTNNPWDLERTPGGSSGGEAASIAAGESPLGLGSDIGGSIRVPAHFSGIQGLKPGTRRLTLLDDPRFFESGQEGLIPSPGPLAREVEDLELAMRIVAAPDQHDWKVPPVPWNEPAKVDVSKLRVGFYVEDDYFPWSTAIKRAVTEASEALRGSVAEVNPWPAPPTREGVELFYGLISAGGGTVMRLLGRNPKTPQIAGLVQVLRTPAVARPALARALRAMREERLADVLGYVRELSAGDYQELVVRAHRFRERVLASMVDAGLDAVICAVHPLPALRHGGSFLLGSVAGPTFLWNLMGVPSGSAAVTRVRENEQTGRNSRSRDRVERAAAETDAGSVGLPVGVQVVAKPWREDIVLALMRTLQDKLRGNPDYPTRPHVTVWDA